MNIVTTFDHITYLKVCGVTATFLLVAAFMILPTQPAAAQSADSLSVNVNGMTVAVSFTRSTPCTPYELNWGDGNVDAVEETSDMCIQVIDEKILRHEYETAGTYTISLTLGGETHTQEVTVPGEELSFGVDDVSSVTSVWVDPYEMMADEEYYRYAITLEGGEEVVVEAAGFTTEEYRNEQFREAGYTGDVNELLALIEQEENPEPPVVSDPEPTGQRAIMLKLIETLEQLLEKMQALIQLRG